MGKLLEVISPDGKWQIEVISSGEGPLYADIRGPGIYLGMPFGYNADANEICFKWNLPDGAWGIFIRDECWLIYRAGPGRRRNREYSRCVPQPPYSEEEIAYICAKKRSQKRGKRGGMESR